MTLIRISCMITVGLIVLSSLTAVPALAQSGVIAFQDACTELLYAMRGDGSGRIALPLPPLPLPTDRYLQPTVLDVTTSGPTTVVYYVGIIGQTFDQGLFAVQVDDVGGMLTPQTPVRLSLPAIAGLDPNSARHGSFSPLALGDRLALVAPGSNASVLMTAKVKRDPVTLKIIDLSDSDFVVVGDLYPIGIPDPNVPTEKGFTGFIAYSPDGTKHRCFDLLRPLDDPSRCRQHVPQRRTTYREHQWLRRVEARFLAGRKSYCLHRRCDHQFRRCARYGHLFPCAGDSYRHPGYQ
jgi:hypothetical protein